MLVVLYKLQEISFLLSCDSFSCNTIVHNNGVQLKLKWIFYQQIIIHRHLKGC